MSASGRRLLSLSGALLAAAPKCWRCGARRATPQDLFCAECNVVQAPPTPDNYFRLFALDESFDVDEKALSAKYRRLQNVLHPDRFASAADDEKAVSQGYSSLLNEAHKTLSSPLKRALHLLRLRGGGDVAEGDRDDPGFLAEILELNEEIDEADGDERLRQLHAKNKETVEATVKMLADCFRKGDLEEARRAIVRLKYYSSVSSRINDLLRERGVTD